MALSKSKETENKNLLTVDIVIIGGGLAGFSMAVALQKTRYSVALVNAQPPFKFESDKSRKNGDKEEDNEKTTSQFDERALALSYSSIQYLKSIDVLDTENIAELTAIKNIHVTDKGYLGAVNLDCDEANKSYLGKVILAKELGQNLSEKINSVSNKKYFQHLFNTTVEKIQHLKSSALLHLSGDNLSVKKITAKLVVLAEGGQSGLSEQIGIFAERKNYDQVGVLANVSTSQKHNNIAYERFTHSGPIALLPLRERDYKLVWTVEPNHADKVMALDDEEFLQELQKAFGDRAGIFKQVGKRVAYPMFEVQRNAMYSGRVALIGNSAHTLHPIAGQGFNLGLRDIQCLVDLLKKNRIEEGDLQRDALKIGDEYAKLRQNDVKRTSLFTDGLVRIFSNNHLPSRLLRNLGLIALQNTPFVKKRFVRKLIGNYFVNSKSSASQDSHVNKTDQPF